MMKSYLVRMMLLAGLTAALAIPPGSLQALAQESGPIQPPPGQKQDSGKGTQQQQPPSPAQKGPQYEISVQSTVVNVDLLVTDQDGNVITGLTKQNFRVFDDGKPQLVTNFTPTDAPITIVVLMEYSSVFYQYFSYFARSWSYEFTNHLGPKDWVALVTFSMKPEIEVDFTQNKTEVQQALEGLTLPGFSESNVFDSIIFTLDRLKDVKGKKSVLVMASGYDTFSKHTFDQTLKRLKDTDVTIFFVGVAEQFAVRANPDISYAMVQNEMQTFCKLTGGYAWFPRFEAEMPDISRSVVEFLRHQYSLAFVPSDAPRDGRYHKLRIDVVDEKGEPFQIANKKGKLKKVIVYAREGYTAPKGEITE